MFSFGLSSVLSKGFVVEFEHVFVCWKWYGTKIIAVVILKYLAQQTILTQSQRQKPWNVTVEIALLYQQLVACLRLCSSVFWCTINMSLVTAMSLLLPFFFYVFIVNFKQISHLHLLLSFVSFVLSPEEATEVFFK